MTMINLLPPSPLGSPPGSGFWNDWYEKLRVLVNTIAAGFSWTLITDKPTTIAGFGITDGVSTSSTLTNNAVILGAGSHTVTAMGSLGTTTTLLHGNAAGAPTFAAVSLSADVSGDLGVSNLNSGTSASSATFWRGDGTWSSTCVGAFTANSFIPASNTVPSLGIYTAAANELSFATNSAIQMHLTSTGLGINNTAAVRFHANHGNTPAGAQEVGRLEVTGNAAANRGPIFTFYAPNDSGTSKIAAQISGLGTGAVNTGGYLSFSTSATGAGTTPTERMRISNAGNITTPAGATNMTDGFFYIPSAAGAPSGVPTTVTGTVPMYYDTTNNNFYVYNGAWKKVLLA